MPFYRRIKHTLLTFYRSIIHTLLTFYRSIIHTHSLSAILDLTKMFHFSHQEHEISIPVYSRSAFLHSAHDSCSSMPMFLKGQERGNSKPGTRAHLWLCEIDIDIPCMLFEIYIFLCMLVEIYMFLACCSKSIYSLECCEKSIYSLACCAKSIFPLHVVRLPHIAFCEKSIYSLNVVKNLFIPLHAVRNLYFPMHVVRNLSIHCFCVRNLYIPLNAVRKLFPCMLFEIYVNILLHVV